jgi:hypothetical protein
LGNVPLFNNIFAQEQQNNPKIKIRNITNVFSLRNATPFITKIAQATSIVSIPLIHTKEKQKCTNP